MGRAKRYFSMLVSIWLCSTVIQPICSWADDPKPLPEDSKSSSKYLFIMHAIDGRIDPDIPLMNEGKLTLYGISKYVFYFSERPNRRAGKENLKDFLQVWNIESSSSFRKEHPNAAIIANIVAKDSPFTEIPVVLSNPVYDHQNERLTFHVKSIGFHILPSTDLGETVLFVDDCDDCIPMKR